MIPSKWHTHKLDIISLFLEYIIVLNIIDCV